MRILVWLARAFVFFTLFAFALNNQEPVTVHWFFGVDWTAPMVIVVLAAFGLGSVTGVLAMLPSWWRQRREASRRAGAAASTVASPTPAATSQTAQVAQSPQPAEHPPRDGL
jgi:putative membrane protein